MSYIPVMGNFDHIDMLDYLDQEITVHFHFARILDRVCCPEPWKSTGYHVVASLRKGGPITRWFEVPGSTHAVVTQSTGAVQLLPADSRRRIDRVDDAKVELRVAVFSCQVFEIDLLSFWDVPFTFAPATEAMLDSAIDALLENEQDSTKHPMARVVERKRLCHGMLADIVAASAPKRDTMERMVMHRDIEPALALLKQHFREPLRADEVSGCCRWSRSQFHHNFRRLVGASPFEYQKRLRVAEAKRLLVQTDMGVAEVGQSVGWDDPFHFSRTFKAEVGSSPSHFRTRCRQGLELHV